MANSPNAYVLLDHALNIVWMNSAYLDVTARTREEIVDCSIFEAFPSDPQSESHHLLEGSLRRVLATGESDEIALIRYDIRMPNGEMEVRYWSATHTPLIDEQGATTHILQHTVDVTELENLRALRDQMGVVERAQAVQARNLNLAAEIAQLRNLFEQAPGFVAVLGGPDHTFQLANDAYTRLVGHREVVGKTIASALPEVVAQGFVARLDEVVATGRPYFGHAERVTLENEVGGPPQVRFLDFIYQPIIADDATVNGVLVQGHDVTEQVTARQRQDILIDELNHRVKNTLAVVQGLASQSFKNIPGSDEPRLSFSKRLLALASAHDILTTRNWQAADLADTISNAVQATAGSDSTRVSFGGPKLELDPQAAISTAMLFHELTTNARKHGALSNEDGRIAVDWTIEDTAEHRLLTVTWAESSGPPVKVPDRTGFGTKLIEQGIAARLGGEVRSFFEDGGLRCIIKAKLAPIE